MIKRHTSRWRKARGQIMLNSDLNQMLDILLAFDRSVVESSMRLYKVPRHDRVAMRAQNQRLHRALRESLPRLLKNDPPFPPKAARGSSA
jgi:hypothetical protein